ncbi:hypothetical protein BDW68DRAFT_175125 [Aspergillus falconensis]
MATPMENLVHLLIRQGELDLRVVESNPYVAYTAFSHVWSDGMGNRTANGLPQCQVFRLRQLIAETYDANYSPFYDGSTPMSSAASAVRWGLWRAQQEKWDHRIEKHWVYFWMDTLCIPAAAPPWSLKRMRDLNFLPDGYSGRGVQLSIETKRPGAMKLGDKERTILSTISVSTTSNDNDEHPQALASISEVIRLTEEQYERSRVDRRIRESSQRIINAALSFKDIISAVATSDPTNHAVSAWAIVSLGLTIAQNRSDLRNALFESSEYLADVLTQCAYIEDKVYLNSSHDIKTDLGNALVRLYGAVLHYTAQIRTAQDPSLGRQLLDCVTAITEHPLTELKTLVEKERNNIAQWIGLVQYLHHEKVSKNILDWIDELLESLNRLAQQFNLVNLSIAKGAFYDLYVNQHEGFCLPDTCIKLHSQITEWAKSSDSKCIFWLNGMAGTGKSTIAQTVAQTFRENQQLGATFFFKKGEADHGDAKYLIPTITKQLVTRHQQLAPGVLKAIEDDSRKIP